MVRKRNWDYREEGKLQIPEAWSWLKNKSVSRKASYKQREGKKFKKV